MSINRHTQMITYTVEIDYRGEKSNEKEKILLVDISSYPETLNRQNRDEELKETK